jgi:hypothetical protein
MRIDQRNAGAAVTVNTPSFSNSIDRWYNYGQSDGIFTVQRSTTAPTGFTNSALITVTTADASIGASQVWGFGQRIEGLNVSDLAWGTVNAQTITLSFTVRSSVTGTFSVTIFNGSFGRGYTATFVINSANTFETKTITIPGDTSGTWNTDNTTGLAIWFGLGSGSSLIGTAGVWNSGTTYSATGQVNLISTLNATFYITGVQLEAGTVATPFERRSYGAELSLCQRYYEACSFQGGSFANSSSYFTVTVPFKVTKRATPTITNGAWTILTASQNTTAATVLVSANTDIGVFSPQVVGSLIAGSTAGSFTASSEL